MGGTRAKCGGPRSPLSAVGPIACCRSGPNKLSPGIEVIFANRHPGGVPYRGPYRVRTKEFLPRTNPCKEQCSTSKQDRFMVTVQRTRKGPPKGSPTICPSSSVSHPAQRQRSHERKAGSHKAGAMLSPRRGKRQAKMVCRRWPRGPHSISQLPLVRFHGPHLMTRPYPPPEGGWGLQFPQDPMRAPQTHGLVP